VQGLRFLNQAFFLPVLFRLKGSWLLVLGAALIACASPAYSQAQTSYYTSLHDALVDYQNIWGVDLAYDAALMENRWTAWSKPERQNAEDDLAVLLVGTGIVAYRLESGTIGLRPSETRHGTISGVVLDAETRQPLRFATITIKGTPYGTATDQHGRFTLENVTAGNMTLVYRYIGYASKSEVLLLTPGAHQLMEASLVPMPIEYEPIEVWGMELFASQLMRMDLVQGPALSRPMGVGISDVIRNLGGIPGVSMDEKSADLHIQGGNFGEHQFYLGGSKVFNPVHVFGVGGFNPFALEKVTVHKAGFEASQGSYLSGVVRAEHAFIDTLGTVLDVHVDPFSFNGRVNLRVGNDHAYRSTLMAAYRTSVWNGWWSGIRSSSVDKLLLSWSEPDLFLFRASMYPLKKLRPDLYKLWTDNLSEVPPPALPQIAFDDFHLAGQVLFDDNWLRASFYRGGNKLHGRHLITSLLEDDESIPRPDAYDWVNVTGELSWSLQASPSVLLSTKFRGSSYKLSHKYAGLDRDDARVLPVGERLFIELTPAEDGNNISEVGLEQVVEVTHAGGKFAASLEYMMSDHRFVVRDIFPQGLRHERRATSLAMYAEEVLTALPGIDITGGLRMTYLRAREQVYAEPRLRLESRLRTGRRGVIVTRLAGGLYYQFLNLFDVSTISPSTLISSTRVWLPVDETLPPPKSYHLTADVGMEFWDHWSVRVEGYYKDQPRVFRIDYPRLWQPENQETVGTEAKDLTSQSDFVALAKGYAYGTAFVLERESARLRLSARYEHNIAEREYAFRGGNIRMVPVPWSEPQRLHLDGKVTMFRNLEASGRWRGVWGRAWGFRKPYYDYLATDAAQGLTFGGVDFREPTSEQHQLSPLKQLDLGLAYQFNVSSSTLHFSVDVLNVLNRKNQAELFLREISTVPVIDLPDDSFEETPDLIIESKNLIGRILSLSLRLHW